MPPPDNGPPRQEEVPIQKTGTPLELTPSVDDLTKSVRQLVGGPSRSAKIYTLMEARGEEITS